MNLVVPDGNFSKCYLTGVGAGSGSLAGASIALPPLDIVCGDILSFSFEKDSSGNMTPERNEAWDRAVFGLADYDKISLHSHDAESSHGENKNSDTMLCIIESFLDLPETLKTFDNFDLYMIASKWDIPRPARHIVPRGFTSSFAESTESVKAHYELAESMTNIKNYLSLWEKRKELMSIESIYEVNGFSDIALVSVLTVLQSKRTLVRCKQCGCFFSPSRAGELYCNRVSLSSKKQTCKDAAKYEKQIAREKASESGKVYKVVSNSLSRRYRDERNEELKQFYWNECEKFRTEAAKFKDSVKCGRRAEQEYIAFLDSYRLRKKK